MQEPEPRDAASRRRPPAGGMGLGAHIRLWMLVVGLVPLAALFAYGYSAARTALIEASDDHLVSVVGARRAQMESWLRERVTDLEVIGGSQDCIGLVQRAVSHEKHANVCQYLGTFQTGARDYQEIALYDLNWNWVASHSGADRHQNPIVDPGFREQLEESSGPVMGPVHRHDELGAGLHAAAPLRRPDGTKVGYVVAALDLTGTFAPILEDRAGLGRTGRVYLADADGRILLSGDADSTDVASRRMSPALQEEVGEGGTGVVHFAEPGGRKVFAGYTVIAERNWVLAAEMDQSEALGLLTSLRRGFILAGLLTLVIVIVLSSRSSRRLSAPLAGLARGARRIKEGHYGDRVPEAGGREVAEVGRAFNEMLDALEDVQRQRIQAGTLAAVGELSSSMVHEMRNRLSSVKMNLQALERRLRSEDAYAELARIALDQVHRTEESLTEMLNYARPVEPVREKVRVSMLLRSLRDRFDAEAASRKVELTVDDRSGNDTVRADVRLMEEALSNLVRNALEAASSGGHVRLRALDGERPGWLAFEVEDDGPGLNGIAPEALFKPFFSTKEKGTGLGLAHARKIAELHGGRVEARKAEGHGTVFRMELPGKEAGA